MAFLVAMKLFYMSFCMLISLWAGPSVSRSVLCSHFACSIFSRTTGVKSVATLFTYSTPRGKTDKLEEPVNRELNITRSQETSGFQTMKL